MSLSTKSGTGLKPVVSPTGLKLSSSPFTAQPDEAVATIDVYKAQTSSGVINSIQEDAGGETEGFFDKIKNAVSGAVGNLTGGLTGGLNLSGGVAGALGTLRSGTNLLRQVTNVASRAMSAVNQIQKGGVLGTVGGLAALGGMGGVQGVSQIASMARGTIGGFTQGGAAGYLRAGASLLGGQGTALGQLAGNIGGLTRAGAYLRSASGSGNFTSLISGVDYSLAATTSALASLDRASQINFENGFNSVVKLPSMNNKSYNLSAIGRVTTALGDFTGGFDKETNFSIPTRAGAITGLATTGAGLGINSIYSLARSQGLDDESAFIAGSALTTHASTSGNVAMLKDIASDPVGLKAVSSNPNAVRMAVAALDMSGPVAAPYKTVYDDLDALAQKTGQSWNSTQRAGRSIYDVTATMHSEYAQQMVKGKAADDDFKSRTTSNTAINSQSATMSTAQYMTAVTSVPSATPQSVQASNPYMSSAEASQVAEDTAWA